MCVCVCICKESLWTLYSMEWGISPGPGYCLCQRGTPIAFAPVLFLFCFFVVGQRYLKFTWSIAVGGAKGLLGFESKNEKRPSASSAWLSWPSGTANKNCYEDDDDDPDGRTPNDGGCCGCSAADAPPPPMMTAAPSPHCSSSASLVSDQITASTRSCWGCS